MKTPDSALFKIGDLVWAKMKGFKPWPGRVTEPSKDFKRTPSKKGYCIFFFGSDNYSWLTPDCLQPYTRVSKEEMSKIKPVSLREAVAAMELFIENGGEVNSDEAFDKLIRGSEASVSEGEPPVPETPENDKGGHEVGGEASSGPAPAKRGRRKKSEDPNSTTNPDTAKTVKRKPDEDKLSSTDKSTTPAVPKKRKALDGAKNAVSGMLMSPKRSMLLDRPPNTTRPETPPLDLKKVSQTLMSKNITPSNLRFGFLGLGIMGSGIAKNLLNSGHKVVVWNRTPDKCNDFGTQGAVVALAPSDVVEMSDIIFSCVSDPAASRTLVYGNLGVLSVDSLANKGYVELGSIDAETSVDFMESITSKGGRYLEAQMQGSKDEAHEGSIVILCAGDRSLYNECHSCFEAFGKSSFFLGETGHACRLNLVLQLMRGIMLAGLAECLALTDRVGLHQSDLMEAMALTNLSNPFMQTKGDAIINGRFTAELPLQHLQKDLRLGMSMGDSYEQPLPLSATTNELFKHAKRLGYGDHDAASIYVRARF